MLFLLVSLSPLFIAWRTRIIWTWHWRIWWTWSIALRYTLYWYSLRYFFLNSFFLVFLGWKCQGSWIKVTLFWLFLCSFSGHFFDVLTLRIFFQGNWFYFFLLGFYLLINLWFCIFRINNHLFFTIIPRWRFEWRLAFFYLIWLFTWFWLLFFLTFLLFLWIAWYLFRRILLFLLGLNFRSNDWSRCWF